MLKLMDHPARDKAPSPGISNDHPHLMSWGIFVCSALTFAYFHQGGGWNQNARFALVRAIVEEGRLSIDGFLIYRAREGNNGERHFVRAPIENGVVTFDDTQYAIAWTSPRGGLVPVAGMNLPGNRVVPVETIAASADLSFFNGHFHPNKAPGTSLLAVPGYFLLFWVERLFGLDADDWWLLTVNAWLTTVLSVGLYSAFGCVVFFRTVLLIAKGNKEIALLSTAGFALATLFFPYATMLYDHNVGAVSLLTSFYLIYRDRPRMHGISSHSMAISMALILSGVFAGFAAISNYVSAVPVVMLGLYLMLLTRKAIPCFLFALGILGPLLIIIAYNYLCFDTPFTTNYSFQNPAFVDPNDDAFLGVFRLPQSDIIFILLFSPFRGLFITSPFLAMGVIGLGLLATRENKMLEACLFASIFTFFLVMNASFYGWDGGFCTGPRFLASGIPFLALPASVAFARWPKFTCTLAICSFVIMACVTAVDPQAPLRPIEPRDHAFEWRQCPLLYYQFPLFGWGRTPIDPRVRGVVSTNPVGIYEGSQYRVWGPESEAAEWNSFNVGEFLFSFSRLSLVPLALVLFISSTFLWRRANTNRDA